MSTSPKAYAICHLRSVRLGPDIFRYIEEIEATMAPYGGRFLVHGGRVTAVEGHWNGDLVIIEFPDREAAAQWYESPAYQEILPLRTENSDSIALLVEGVPTGYRAVDKLPQLMALAG